MPPFDLVDPRRTTPVGIDVLRQRTVPPRLHDLRRGAALYQVDQGLATAINVALAIGSPLLVTGEPGTGKTQLAYYLAWYFDIEADEPEAARRQPYTLSIKSTTVARDLLYDFDTVAYFRDARVSGQGDTLDKRRYVRKGPLWEAFDEIEGGRPAVVLLDEIDKAPRDFPNDLLRELDQFSFVVKETGETIRGRSDAPPPIVVVTSNSEKPLPPAFLRRCVFHHIVFDEALVRRAIWAWRRAQAGGAPETDAAEQPPSLSPRDEAVMHAFMRIRDVRDMEKLPATAELLGWLSALDSRGAEASEFGERVRLSELPLLSAVVKDREDLERVRAS
ncbi:MAG: MoxR family ATPase [Deltaproteobacteria bacterium]|nr:MoxR family ATPase [Deltaproteobacteria bacterium]